MQIDVISDHTVPAHAPLRVRVGEEVHVGERDDDWPAFVFITRDQDVGWVPERHLDDRRPVAAVIEPYDTTELPVTRGGSVELLRRDDPSGWGWCRRADGTEGWLPYRVLGLPGG